MIRGFLCRKHLKESEPVYLNKKKELEKEKQREIRELYSDVTEKMKLSDQTSEEFLKRYRSVVQARVSCVLYQFFHGPKIQRNICAFYSRAATVIQRGFRKHRIQLWRKYGSNIFVRNGKIRFFNERDDAAARIQRCWKSFVNRNIFKFYQKLISSRERMDPYIVLRSINPVESGLIDAASGLHIRFRLGGTVFPPIVCYKIYTHNPVIDINSFAPRDYTKYEHIREPKEYHSHPIVVNDDRRGWYQRLEMNGWRPVTNGRITETEYNDNSTKLSKSSIRSRLSQDTSATFHYSSVQRRQDIIARRKRRKVEWMKKLYGSNLTRDTGKEGDPNLIGEELKDFETVDEDELQGVIDWSNSLNFERYIEEWTGLAITLPSDQKTHLANDQRKVANEPAQPVLTRGSHSTEKSPMLDDNTNLAYELEREKIYGMLSKK